MKCPNPDLPDKPKGVIIRILNVPDDSNCSVCVVIEENSFSCIFQTVCNVYDSKRVNRRWSSGRVERPKGWGDMYRGERLM